MANLGYIGLGVMGSWMVDRLMAKGHVQVLERMSGVNE
jgi:3-hydroxyisobutyrate dehydrogenase-like beta-hydroxyacid dehydrogenase